jgi:CheY-like chemotaxis protein
MRGEGVYRELCCLHRNFPGQDKEIKRMDREVGLLEKDYSILVVDDEPIALNVLAKMLEKLGYFVETALGSQEAITRLVGAAYSTVITDFDMPTLNGQQLAGWIKQHHPRTKVVIMTGFSSAETVRLKTGGDIDALLFKPIGLKELRDLISDLDLSDPFHPHPLSKDACPFSRFSGPFTGSKPNMTFLPGEDNEE